MGKSPPNLHQRITTLIKKTFRLSKEQDQQAWVDNVKSMLDKNMKGAHKFCNSHNLPPKLLNVVANGVVSVRETVEKTVAEWDGVWGGSHGNLWITFRLLKK